MNTYEIDLDVSKSTVTNSPVVLGQGDKSATTIVARIFDHGSPISASGLTAKLKMRLPDGRHFYEKSATWDATTSKATVTVDETQAASATGETREAYFELMQGSTVICSTSRFSVRVLRSATQGMDGAESYSEEIEQLVDDLNAAKTAAQNATAGANSAATAANGAATAANTAATNIQTKANRGDFDGVSPNASVERQTGGALVRVTDRSGTTTAMVYDGAKGDKGDRGDAYEITSADYDEIAERVEVPLMSASVRGGAKLGDGLVISNGELNVDWSKVARADDVQSLADRMDAAQSLRKGSDGYYVNESITAWFARNFDGRVYGYSEPKTTAVPVTKTGANAGLPNPTLGTRTVPGTSVYRNLGPFQWKAAKGHVDADGVPHVKVIWGVDTLADWQACDENVWSMRPICWFDVDDTGTSLIGTCSDTWHPGMRAGHWSYLPDGTLRPYMLAARYPLGFEGGVGVSKSGLKCYGRDVSHNSLITKLDMANGGYSGKTAYEQWYDVFMSRMIYGTKDFQLVMQGCTNYSFQYHPAIAETNVKRVILTNAQAANLVVGSTMMLGNQATASTDRNNANCYNVFDGLVIDSITTYDANNKAVNFATDSTFSTATAYLLSTAPWHSGSCDGMDWDGSPTNAQSGREVAFFQGCELMHGATEVLSGVILHNDGTSGWVPYVVADTRKDATSLTSDFESCGAALPTDANDSWKYPLYIGFHGGLMYGTNVGGSTTTGACDGHYTNKLATTGDREWRSSGYLRHSRNAGPAYVVGDGGLGDAVWYICSRLSGAGRGFGGES